MLLFTPDVVDALRWFERTHHLLGGFGWARMQRTALPAPGAVGDQPAKLMEAIEVIAREHNRLLRGASKPRRERRDKQPGKTPRG